MKKENYRLIEWIAGAIAGACFILFNTIASNAGVFSPNHNEAVEKPQPKKLIIFYTKNGDST
ncbi:MAG: hypothetical protein IBX50_09320 [Marinospirillum sp.]|uniref:hypothetical protein n=1 Tax=Marinospirillum sp. TaxID=2183934 RepID=UPI0019FEDB8C|nr:hypothetical protein [Marinospirillum sp.]MBE0506901.1 hypothetical protein [Marinospirillum sp.]